MVIKKVYLPLIALFIGTLALSSCKKEGCTDSDATNYSSEADKDDGSCIYPVAPAEPEPEPAPVPSEPFTAKIDGVEFVEDNITATMGTWTQTLSIRGDKANGQYVRVTMPSTISPGTYSFQDPDAGSQGGYYHDGNSIYGAASGTGTLTIVSHNTTDNTISGFFSFTAEEYAFSSGNASYVVSSGEFVVSY